MTLQEALTTLRQRARSNYLKTQPHFLQAVKLAIVVLQEKVDQGEGEQP